MLILQAPTHSAIVLPHASTSRCKAPVCEGLFDSFVVGTERQLISILLSRFASRQEFLPIDSSGQDRPASRSHVFVDSSRLSRLRIALRASLCLFRALLLAGSQITRSAVDSCAWCGNFLASACFLESCDVFDLQQLQISSLGSLRSFNCVQ